jgi:hypothetical protein
MQLRGVVLVEGTSDRRAVEALARRRGRDLQAEGIAIVPMGGYGNLPRLLGQYRGVRLAGLYDVGEERHFLRALGCADRGDLERIGFYACTRDLEDELTRAVGPDGMERVLAEQKELRAFRTYQKQPAHRARPLEEQLHGFVWNRKQRYAVFVVEALDLERVPRPLDRVLTHGPRPDARIAQRFGEKLPLNSWHSLLSSESAPLRRVVAMPPPLDAAAPSGASCRQREAGGCPRAQTAQPDERARPPRL